MPGMNNSYTAVATEITHTLFSWATQALAHTTIFGGAGYFAARQIRDEAPRAEGAPVEVPSRLRRAISFIRKIPAFLGYYVPSVIALEAIANEPTTKFYADATKEKLRPAITSFLKPFIEKISTPLLKFLEEKGYIKVIEQIPENFGAKIINEVSPTIFDQIFSLFSEKAIPSSTSIAPIAPIIEHTVEACTLDNLEACFNQSLAFIEEAAPYAGENIAHLLENILEHGPSSLALPSAVLNAISEETGLPYYATFLITSGILTAAGSAVYGLMNRGTNVNQHVLVNQNQSSVQNASASAAGGHVTVQNLVLPESMVQKLLKANSPH